MANRAWVATRKGLFCLARDGQTWAIERVQFLGDPVSAIAVDATGSVVYAALNLGHFGAKVHRSKDCGTTWHEVAAPEFPEKPADSADTVPWALQQVWTLEVPPMDSTGTIWAGTIPGGLFKSIDGARSWSLVRSLWDRAERAEWFGGGYDFPGIHSICFNASNHLDIFLGISCGGAWASDDGGATWRLSAKGMRASYMPPERHDDQNIQDPHRVVRCRTRPNVFWCQHHDGVFRSVDNGASWTEITNVPESKFGFAVAAHPLDPDTAWFIPAATDQCRVPVGARPSVLRTRDGGKSFEKLDQGLAPYPSYDLVYRHNLDVSEDGNNLLFGSTTGHLYGTSNGGDLWQAVPVNFPPIYAVRFG
jgi:photosystem II stability/assembly factor-like uncharacterized protein